MKTGFEPEKTALIIIDVQNDFCHENGLNAKFHGNISDSQEIIPKIDTLINEARKLGIKIVFVQTVHTEHTVSKSLKKQRKLNGFRDIVKKGGWGADFYKLLPQEQDVILEKHQYSAFFGTSLDMILKNSDIKSLLLTGVATNVCVDTTARDGFMLDYNITVVKDACASSSKEMHSFAIENIDKWFGQSLDVQDVLNYLN